MKAKWIDRFNALECKLNLMRSECDHKYGRGNDAIRWDDPYEYKGVCKICRTVVIKGVTRKGGEG